MKKFFKKRKPINILLKEKTGIALIEALILVMVMALFLAVMVTLTLLGLSNSRQGVRQTLAVDVAEAGINYYLWHLVHDPNDYQDGTGAPATPPYGPYQHDFYDNTGEKVGTYTLWITPPQGGGNLVTVESRGDVEDGNQNRTIVAKLGIPSFAQYAVVANDTVNHIRFGTGTEIFGPIHNNGGIRMDGVVNGLATSALANYNDPDHSGPNEDGVHTHQPDPAQVFLGGKSFPVPAIDFNQITADLNEMQTKAQDDGVYYGDSGARGYNIVLNDNPTGGDTFSIYRVDSITSSCWGGWWLGWQSTDGIASQTLIAGSVPFPNNGIIFVEDDLWVDGKISDSWVTLVAATLPDSPSTRRSIFINNDLEYTYYDGRDKIGLIAQDDIGPGLFSEGSFSGSADQMELRVDAALLAQNGRVGRNYFSRSCNSTYYQRKKITVYGSIGTARRYGFAWICGSTWTIGNSCDSGYELRDVVYDQNMNFEPPPSWPTIGNYAILDWREK